MLPELAGRIAGSSDLFEKRGRRPWASVNFVTAHDGFTLHDLVSYNEKHNWANGEDNRDGHSANHSWNHGVEGETNDPAIREARAKQQRNLLATLFLSQGTPMMLAGDEIGHSQKGNNNAYCQDNEISWLDWSQQYAKGPTDGAAMLAFTKRLIALRKAHPVLRRPVFLHGRKTSANGLKDIVWYTPHGVEKAAEHWRNTHARCIALLLNGHAGSYTGVDGAPQDDGILLIVLNAHTEAVTVTLPEVPNARGWRCVLDTRVPDGAGDERMQLAGRSIPVDGRTALVFVQVESPAR